jgi:hypothetical protein
LPTLAILLIMTEQEKKAFDFAADTTKQLITLATGIIAITITFSKDILGASLLTNSTFIFISWGLFILSIVSGIWSLLALTGNLQPMAPSNQAESPTINSNNIRVPVFFQIICFIFGLMFTVIFGASSVANAEDQNDIKKNAGIEIIKNTEYQIIKPSQTEKAINVESK